MDDHLTLSRLGMLVVSVLFGSGGQVLLKMGLGTKIPIDKTSAIKTVMNILSAAANPMVLGGLALYVLSAMIWLLVISRVRLSVAYPMISLSYILVVLLSALVLKEHITWKYAIAGMLLISGGVTFIGLGLGTPGPK